MGITVSVDAAPGITTAGAKAQLVPRGKPAEQVNVTGLLKPPLAPTDTL